MLKKENSECKCVYPLQEECTNAGLIQKVCLFIFASILAQVWSFLQMLLQTQGTEDDTTLPPICFDYLWPQTTDA